MMAGYVTIPLADGQKRSVLGAVSARIFVRRAATAFWAIAKLTKRGTLAACRVHRASVPARQGVDLS